MIRRRALVFGEFRLEPNSGTLWNGDRRIRLQEQPLKILELLLDPSGDVVHRERIREALWPDQSQGDFEHRIQIAVSKLRRALRDSADSPKFVETVPKRGYRFVHAVETVESAAREGAAGQQVSLVVLPFEELSAVDSCREISAGLTDELIAQLAQLDPRLVLRTDRDAFVDYVLEGTVRVSASGRVRVTSRLLRAADGTYAWARGFESQAQDVIEIQKDLAGLVARRVGHVLLASGAAAPAEDPSILPSHARELYLRGRHYRDLHTAEGLGRALGYFEEAIAENPEFADAYASAASCYCLIGGRGFEITPPRESMPMARALAQQGLDVDPDLPEAHAVLGMVHLKYDWDLSAAEGAFQRALELRPDYADAHLWMSIKLEVAGQASRALEHATQAREFAPTSADVLINLAVQLARSGDTASAMVHIRDLQELHPGFWGVSWGAGLVALMREEWSEAVQEFARAVELSNGSELPASSLGYACAKDGRTADAERVLSDLLQQADRRYLSPVFPAFVYGGLGRLDDAFESLEAARHQRSRYMIWLDVGPESVPLREDSRYADLLNRIGLTR